MVHLDLHRVVVRATTHAPETVSLLELINYVKMDPDLLRSLVEMVFGCFEAPDIGVNLPSTIYFLATGKEVVASVFLTEKSQFNLNGYYVYNVCTTHRYRGQGLMKQLLAWILKFHVTYSAPVFYLMVAPTNLPAYQLYRTLGFIKVDQVEQPPAHVLVYVRPLSFE